MIRHPYFTVLLCWQIACCSILAALSPTKQLLPPHILLKQTSPLLMRAERLFCEELYQDAIPLYEELFQDNPSPLIASRLAQSYYLLGQFDHVIKLASSNTPLSETLYLQALSYKKLQQTELSKTTLLNYLQLGDRQTLPHYSEALFELGMIAFFSNDLYEAKMYFLKSSQSSVDHQLAFLSNIYLARIEMLQQRPQDALNLLNIGADHLPQDHPLNKEISYWTGEAYLKLQQLTKAMVFFERALPNKQALHQLGLIYLKLTENPNLSTEIQLNYFEKAECIFTELAEIERTEQSIFDLGKCYLIKAKQLSDHQAYEKAKKLFEESTFFMNPEMREKSLFSLVESAPTYQERELLYQELTTHSLEYHPLYARYWYLRGLNHFEEAQKLSSIKKNEELKYMYEQAAIAFQKTVDLLENKAAPLMGQAVKYQALSHFYQNTPDSRLKGWKLLDDFLLTTLSDNPAELFYIRGLMAAHVVEKNSRIDLATSAEVQILTAIENYPNSPFISDLIYLLGHFYLTLNNPIKAEEAFLKLANLKMSPLSGEGWFWAAVCAEKLNRDNLTIKEYRKHVFEEYPESPSAPEAYLHYYSLQEYMQGHRYAIKHLHKMEEKFPENLFLVQAHYWIGLDHKKDRRSSEGKLIKSKNYTAAIDAFQKAESIFDTLLTKNAIPNDLLKHFVTLRYRSTLERALANLAIAEDSTGTKKQIYLEYAEEVFAETIKAITSSSPHLVKILYQEDVYPKLLEEAQFWLAHVYIELKNDFAAKELLNKMIETYRSVKTTQGYFLSRTWFELAMIAIRGKEYTIAIQYLLHAEDTSKGKILSTDQRLDLWIQRSLCYRELQQYDQAMTLLSQVINDEGISGLRVKAMYLRAELYELQGRHELALKQREAASKKGRWKEK